ncbi:MAG: response regulator [Candidatus Omnitrophica bacterium]|nr:response regulator [Candidatus Omnitrophota bacterium]
MISLEQIFNARILILDDQKLHSLFLKEVLSHEGYKNILSLMDPLKTIDTCKEFKPDLIILDLLMPHLDGFQVMEQLHDFRLEHYLPILAVSGDRAANVRLRALQSGATDFLNKPFENIEIIVKIRNMIELRILHNQISNQNKLLELKVDERTKELRYTQFDIIRRLAQAAEFRDGDTGIHIIRMSQYAMKLGQALGLPEADCDLLHHASPLHDVGKIGIPDSILLKPGKLTTEEFEIMKTHTTIGAKILAGSDSPVMKLAEIIALTHHERWDGKGYPYGIKRDEIPFVGQICSVCDVFDALTSERPYKKAWSVEDAVAEVIRMRDLNFNPRIVDCFIEILPAIKSIRAKFQ